MEKIPTIFDRDWEGNRGIVNKPLFQIPSGAVATEKLDGTNVRITVRNSTVVRAEKRRNPDKIQKHKGITEPWYIDADENDTQDKWIFDGIKNTNFYDIRDGEWSGELVGANIQGNPLGLDGNEIMFFSLGLAPEFKDAPTSYDKLKVWLPAQESLYGEGKIEGVVWWHNGKPIGKIKTKDFK